MKKNLVFLIAVGLSSSCSWNKIGTLNVVSTRNFNTKENYVLVQKEIEAKASTSGYDAMETAIDKAVKKFPTGEFMENVRVYMKSNGKKIKVVGDVWGTQPPLNQEKK